MSVPLRLSLFFALYFTAYGVLTPYWPVWLADRGLSSADIGLVFAAGMVAKTIGVPLFTALADQLGRRKGIILGLMIATTVSTGSLALVGGFWPILIICALITAFGAGCVSLSDNIALLRARVDGFAYSRVRLWGSISFLIVSLLFGAWLPHIGAGGILWAVMIGFAIGIGAALLLPEVGEAPPAPGAAPKSPLRNWLTLLRHKPLMRLYLATALLQNAHLFYYAFGSLHWRSAGLSDPLIGWLWAEGVLAEVLLFAIAPRFGWGRRTTALFALAVGGGLIRWTVIALTNDPAALIAVNILHALTFGACHLATMAELTERAPPGYSASAQGLYAAFSGGIVAAIVFVSAGPLYAWAGQLGFLAPTAMTLTGGLIMFWPRRKEPAA